MVRTFKLTVAYDGTDYAGWQIQPAQPTVQGKLQRAVAEITGSRVSVVGSGRTDSGVHAIAQVASCSIPTWRASGDQLRRALNTKLPDTIAVLEAVDAPEGFHALRDAIGKRYRYQIRVGGVRDAFQHRYHWHLRGTLDTSAMAEAAVRLVGRHDFASFQASGGKRKTTVRDVRACDVTAGPGPSTATLPSVELAVEVEADGFLYNMVRNIVGTLVEIGRGKQPPQWIDRVLASADRDAAGPTAPPQGLFLQRVDYPPFS